MLWTCRRHREAIETLAASTTKLITSSRQALARAAKLHIVVLSGSVLALQALFICDAKHGFVLGQEDVLDVYYPDQALTAGHYETLALQRTTHGHLMRD